MTLLALHLPIHFGQKKDAIMKGRIKNHLFYCLNIADSRLKGRNAVHFCYSDISNAIVEHHIYTHHSLNVKHIKK